MSTVTISTKELRTNFASVLDAMASGQSLTLLYRSQPLAEIKPIPQAKSLGRNFSTAQINTWIKDDQLTKKEVKQINEIIHHLS